MSSHTVIGRTGHMDGGQVVDDEVRVLFVDGDVVAVGRGATEAEAVEDAEKEVARFLAEQAILNTPQVVAAREALAEALRIAREA